jgi:hypothetical protein
LLGVYVLGGIFSGLTFVLSYIFIGKAGLLVGASGAIMAILIATATYAPFMLLRIPLIGIVKLWHVAFVILLVDLIQMPLDNTGGHLAHLRRSFIRIYLHQVIAIRQRCYKAFFSFIRYCCESVSNRKRKPHLRKYIVIQQKML